MKPKPRSKHQRKHDLDVAESQHRIHLRLYLAATARYTKAKGRHEKATANLAKQAVKFVAARKRLEAARIEADR